MHGAWARLSTVPNTHRIAALVVAALVAAACGDDDDPGLDAIDTPTFEPAEDGTTEEPTSSGDGASGSGDDGGAADGGDAPATFDGGDDGATAGDGGGAPADAPVQRVAFDDPVGDATPGVGTSQPPRWSDLAGGALERKGNAFRLDIVLGDTAPTTSNGQETFNVASFFDVDGDGAVEYEIWVNLGPDGWLPVWYDDQGNAAPGEESNVTVELDGPSVVLVFPDVILDAPDRLRFSLASEYGDLGVIGSSYARRDDAPDGDRAVSFPQ